MNGETTRRDFLAAAVGTGVGLAMGGSWSAVLAQDLSKAKLLHHIDCTEELPPEKYFGLGNVKVVETAAGRYREAEATTPSRFGYRFPIEHVGRPHVAVIRYPDDKQRFMCVMDGTCYDIQTGIFTGWAEPLSGKMLELRQVFWPRWNDCSIVFGNWHDGEPAAAASIDVYELPDLPPLSVPGDPGDGTRRDFGIQYEDPCGIGSAEGSMNHTQWIDRIVQYAHYTGQKLLIYPIAWYHGPVFPSEREPANSQYGVVTPDRKSYGVWSRNPPDWFATLLDRFSKEGMEFQGSMTLMRLGSLMAKMNIDLDAIKSGAETYNNMRHDNQVQTSTNDWTPEYNVRNYNPEEKLKTLPDKYKNDPKRWAYGEIGTEPRVIGPMFNPLHPTVQEAILGFVKEIGERYGKYPAFKGISFNMFISAMPWFGSIYFGYDDYTVALFEKETGITVPGKQTPNAPDRFAKRYEFLTSTYYSAWVAWRCEKIRELFGRIHKTLAAARPDLRVTVTLWDETVVFLLGYPIEALQCGTRKSMVELYREAGIDVDLYRDQPGLEIDRGMGNSRDRGGHWSTIETVYRDADYLEQDSIDAYHNLDKPGAFIFNCWVENWGKRIELPIEKDDPNLPKVMDMDGKQADGVGRGHSTYPKDGFWWEPQLRITPGFPAGVHFLEPYAAAVADFDACRITRGGLFLDKAHSEELQQFAKAYRALPKQKFETVGTATDPVVVRTAVYDGHRYFYAVNRDYYPVKLEIGFSAATSAEDLTTGKKINVPKQWATELGPYELRSFRIPSDVELAGFTATAPEAIVRGLRTDAEQALAAFAKVRAAGKFISGMDKMEQQIQVALADQKWAWLRRALTSYVVRKSRE